MSAWGKDHEGNLECQEGTELWRPEGCVWDSHLMSCEYIICFRGLEHLLSFYHVSRGCVKD